MPTIVVSISVSAIGVLLPDPVPDERLEFVHRRLQLGQRLKAPVRPHRALRRRDHLLAHPRGLLQLALIRLALHDAAIPASIAAAMPAQAAASARHRRRRRAGPRCWHKVSVSAGIEGAGLPDRWP